MKKLLKNIFIHTFLAIYFISITGIPVFMHICNISHKKTTSLPYFHKVTDPCCGETISLKDLAGKSLDAEKCCSMKYSFLKNLTLSELTFFKTQIKFLTQEFFSSFVKNSFESCNTEPRAITDNYSPPPLLSGIQLIHFIQNIKIPLS